MDAIQISTIRCYGYTGYFPEEQVLGQWFEVDLTISMDLSITGADDNLENTLNDAEVVDRVSALVETSRFKTIERLNAVITESVLAFAPVQTVRSRRVKVSPPISGFAGSITIEMTRSSEGWARELLAWAAARRLVSVRMGQGPQEAGMEGLLALAMETSALSNVRTLAAGGHGSAWQRCAECAAQSC